MRAALVFLRCFMIPPTSRQWHNPAISAIITPDKINSKHKARCKMSITIACGQMEVLPGRPDMNTKKILELIAKAKTEGVDLLLLPEMSIPGYLLGDLWEQTAFLKDCQKLGEQVIAATSGITVIFGNVAIDWEKFNEDGRPRKYNAAFIAQNGKLLPTSTGYPFVI